MTRAVITSLPGRLGAVMVALTLTGAPALAARPEAAEHRCLCKAHASEHECACARCHHATAKRRDQAAPAQPSCHRAPSRAASKETKPAPPRRAASQPCVTGSCGGPERHGASLTPLDAFTLSLALAPAVGLPPAGSVERPSGTLREAPSLPETPPPRAAL